MVTWYFVLFFFFCPRNNYSLKWVACRFSTLNQPQGHTKCHSWCHKRQNTLLLPWYGKMGIIFFFFFFIIFPLKKSKASLNRNSRVTCHCQIHADLTCLQDRSKFCNTPRVFFPFWKPKFWKSYTELTGKHGRGQK